MIQFPVIHIIVTIPIAESSDGCISGSWNMEMDAWSSLCANYHSIFINDVVAESKRWLYMKFAGVFDYYEFISDEDRLLGGCLQAKPLAACRRLGYLDKCHPSSYDSVPGPEENQLEKPMDVIVDAIVDSSYDSVPGPMIRFPIIHIIATIPIAESSDGCISGQMQQ